MAMPTILIIFGVTGDLTSRKLVPGIFKLFKEGLLPDNFQIVGFSRRNLNDEEFREMMRDTPPNPPSVRGGTARRDSRKWDEFARLLTYQKGNFEADEGFEKLAGRLVHSDNPGHVCANKLLYLATPPKYYHTILDKLEKFNLNKTCGTEEGWTRIVVEKPFGRDLQTAKELDLRLAQLFHERQIFRIDHYLGKDSLQNVMAFRFGNPIFEPVWNRNYVERVGIKILETLGMEGRGAFYDDIGALRDMGQNHLLQMLAMTAMDPPYSFEPEAVRDERSKVLKSLRPIKSGEVDKYVVRGQYKGYKEEPNVAEDSKTETFFRAKLYVDNERWEGVPFFIRTGKRMDRSAVEVSVYFKDVPHRLFAHGHGKEQNFVRFQIQPKQMISLGLFVKHPGLEMKLDPQQLSYDYKSAYEGQFIDAYEKVLVDCLRGDQTLFARTDGIMAAWNIITPIIEGWEANNSPLFEYEAGSGGPVEAFTF